MIWWLQSHRLLLHTYAWLFYWTVKLVVNTNVHCIITEFFLILEGRQFLDWKKPFHFWKVITVLTCTSARQTSKQIAAAKNFMLKAWGWNQTVISILSVNNFYTTLQVWLLNQSSMWVNSHPQTGQAKLLFLFDSHNAHYLFNITMIMLD